MVLEELPEEIEEVRNLLTSIGSWQTFDGDNYDLWSLKIRDLLRSQDLWHFVAEVDPNDLVSFQNLIEYQKERRQVVALSIIQNGIDYSIFHNISDASTPKEAWDILKAEFNKEEPEENEAEFSEEEPVDFASHAKHQESHSEVEDSQEDCVYDAANDQVSPAKLVDLDLFTDDSGIKPVNVEVPSDLSNSLSEKETVDSSIEVAIACSSKNQKTRSLMELYEKTPIIDEQYEYALFPYQPTVFEEAVKDAHCLQDATVNENDNVASIETPKKEDVEHKDEEYEEVKSLQE